MQALATATVDTRAVVAVAAAKEVLLHDLATGAAIGLALRGHTDVIRALDVADLDGRPVLCSAGDDGTARLWDLRSAQPVPLDAHRTDVTTSVGTPDRAITAVALTEIDGHATLLTGGTDGILRIRDLATGEVHECTGHDRQISEIAVGVVDGDPIAATSSWDGTVRTWRLRDASTTAVLIGHDTWVNAVTIVTTPERVHVISAGNDDTVRLWDAATGQPLLVIASPISTIRSLAATTTDNGLALAGAGVSGALCWWNLSAPEIHTRVMTGHTESVAAVRIGRLDGAPVIVTGGGDESVRSWDPTTPSGRATATASGQRHDTDIAALTLATIEGDQIVASGDENGTLCLWRLADGTPVASFTADDLGADPPAEFGAAGPDIFALDTADLGGAPALVIARADGTLTVLDLTSSTVLYTLHDHLGPVTALTTATIDGRPHLFSAGDDAVIRVHDLESGQLTAELAGHTDFVNALTGLGEGMIASGSTDGTIRIWRTADGARSGRHSTPTRTPSTASPSSTSPTPTTQDRSSPARETTAGSRSGTCPPGTSSAPSPRRGRELSRSRPWRHPTAPS